MPMRVRVLSAVSSTSHGGPPQSSRLPARSVRHSPCIPLTRSPPWTKDNIEAIIQIAVASCGSSVRASLQTAWSGLSLVWLLAHLATVLDSKFIGCVDFLFLFFYHVHHGVWTCGCEHKGAGALVASYAYDKAMVGVVGSRDTSQVFLCATDEVSTVAAPVESFKQAVKLNGPAITLCNDYGGVCILFKDESTLKDFAKSVADVAPVIAQALDLEETTIATDRSESSMSDSLLSELSASFLSNFSDIEADDDEAGLGWELVDN
ncbi:hypothetical protein LXA43DRAFT_1097702 [Ganoderma leucocontextum]|nr:hypothetical protein LXA43DRAFT_1097702 [Ganoderma leucocontextum]